MTKMNTLSAYDRATILESCTKMDERREEFAEIIAKEAAKPIRAARRSRSYCSNVQICS